MNEQPTLKDRAKNAWESPRVKIAIIGTGTAILAAMFPELAQFFEQLGTTLSGQ